MFSHEISLEEGNGILLTYAICDASEEENESKENIGDKEETNNNNNNNGECSRRYLLSSSSLFLLISFEGQMSIIDSKLSQ